MAEVDYKLKDLSEDRIADGVQKSTEHWSPVTNSTMKMSIYLPDLKTPDEKLHTLFFLSGIGSNEKDFLVPTKFQKHACQYRFIVVGVDTSPRVSIPGDSVSFMFGQSASWFVDSLTEPWKKHYQMYSYVTQELPDLLEKHYPISGKFGICGHSMGGHGAFIMTLRNPEIFQSVSAFAPCCNPLAYAKLFLHKKYLGDDNTKEWDLYDSCVLAKRYDGPFREILIDIGKDDPTLNITLHPERLINAISENPYGDSVLKVTLRMQEGFDHSNAIAEAFFEDHFKHHKANLDSV